VKGRVKRGETCAMGSCYDPPRPVWRASDESDQWQPGPPRTGTNVRCLARAWANRVTLSRPPASERLGLGGPSLSVARVSTPGRRRLGLPPDLDRPGRLQHQQGLCEARLGYRDAGVTPIGALARGPGLVRACTASDFGLWRVCFPVLIRPDRESGA